MFVNKRCVHAYKNLWTSENFTSTENKMPARTERAMSSKKAGNPIEIFLCRKVDAEEEF